MLNVHALCSFIYKLICYFMTNLIMDKVLIEYLCSKICYVQKTVILTKSVEYMPFLLSFILFINGGVWTVYAVLVQDLFVAVSS